MSDFEVNDRRGTNRRPGVDAAGMARIPEPTPYVDVDGNPLPELPPKWSAPLSRMDDEVDFAASELAAAEVAGRLRETKPHDDHARLEADGSEVDDAFENVWPSDPPPSRATVDAMVASNDAKLNDLARQGVVFTVGNDLSTVSNRVWLMAIKLEALFDHLFGAQAPDNHARLMFDYAVARKFNAVIGEHMAAARRAAITRGVGGMNGAPPRG